MSRLGEDLLIQIVKAANLCFKPWIYSMVEENSSSNVNRNIDDVTFRLEARNKDGKREPVNDFAIEVYKSGTDISLIVTSSESSSAPILWQGQHSLWMNSETGSPCEKPNRGNQLEGFARKLRAIFLTLKG